VRVNVQETLSAPFAETPRLISRRRGNFIACAILLTLCSAVAAYFRIFTDIQPFDDEGLLTTSIKHFLDGHPMYDSGGSYYGPLYYSYEWLAHALMGVSVSNESMRFVSLAFWIASPVLLLLLVYRATGSLILAAGAHFMALCALEFIALFPAHPQEFCMLLLAGFALSGYARNRTIRAVLLGGFAAAMAATKINLGVYAALVLAIAFAYAARPVWLQRLAFLSFAGLGFPILLMWSHLAETWAMKYCLMVVLSLAAAILTVSRRKLEGELGLREFAVAGVSFAAVITAASLLSLAHGGSLRQTIYWLILAPQKAFSTAWFLEPFIRTKALPLALAGLVAAWYAGRDTANHTFVALLKLGLFGGVVYLSVVQSYYLLLRFAVPFLWLVADGTDNEEAGRPDRFARAILALTAVIQVLYAYPVAADPHVRFVAVFIIVIAVICLRDGLQHLSGRWALLQRPFLLRTAAAMGVLFLAGLNVGSAWLYVRRYQSFEPLNIAGMQRIHVKHDQGAALRRLVQRVATQRCTTLFTVPTVLSLNLWTRTQPLTLAGGNWINATDDTFQEEVVRDAERQPQACVIFSQKIIETWMLKDVHDVSSKPVVRFIRENYRPEFEVRVSPDWDYRFMVPKEADTAR
jgi:hypothetical protein